MTQPPLRWIALFLVTLALLLWRESRGGVLRTADTHFAAWLARESHSMSEPTTAAVTWVEMDEPSDGSPGPRWEPLDYALFLKAALPLGPSVAVITPVLGWKNSSPAYLNILRDYCLKTPRLVLGTTLGRALEPEEEPSRLPVLPVVHGDASAIPEFSAVTAAPPGELRDIGTPGVILPTAPLPKPWTQLVVRYRGDLVPTLPLQTLLYWAKVNPAEVQVRIGEWIAVGPKIRIPINHSGASLIDPHSATGVRHIPYSDLLVEAEHRDNHVTTDEKGPKPGDAVLLGKRADAAPLAATIAALQSGQMLRETPRMVGLAVGLGVGVAGLGLLRLRRSTAVLVVALASASGVLVALGVAGSASLALPAAIPGAMLIAVLIVRILAGNHIRS